MNRIYRLELIKTLLQEESFSNQEELQQALSLKGVQVTQATLSRDMKTLRVSRLTDGYGKTKYVLQDAATPLYDKRELPDHLDGVISVEFSGQLGVIRTIPGFANAVAYYIDQAGLNELMGTIAGDDTILLIARTGISDNQLSGSLVRVFKSLSAKFL